MRQRWLSTATRHSLPLKRTHFVFGANTDVGKTVVSAGLVRASLKQHQDVHYIKPLQSGGSDEGFVRKYNKESESYLKTSALFSWDTPTSPHAASRLENKPVSDDEVLASLLPHLGKSNVTYIETAGGVMSPSSASPDNLSLSKQWGWKPQADVYQSLCGFAPVVLVGDGRLGGISATLTALESLVLRGYDVSAIVLLEHGESNAQALREYVAQPLRAATGEPILAQPEECIVSLPNVPEDMDVPLYEWFDDTSSAFLRLDTLLQTQHEGYLGDLKTMKRSALKSIWFPSTQHKTLKEEDLALIDSVAAGELIQLREQDQGILYQSESFFCNDVRISPNTRLSRAGALSRYGHESTMTPHVHAPALNLVQSLLSSNSWASRVLLSKSEGIEAAIPTAIRLYQHRNNVDKPGDYDWAAVGHEGLYLGDTLGATTLCEPRCTYEEDVHPWYQTKSLLFELPTVVNENEMLTIKSPRDGLEYTCESVEGLYDLPARLIGHRQLYSQYKELIEMQWLVFEHAGVQRKVAAAVILDSVTSVSRKVIDPLFQIALQEVAVSRNVPVIHVATAGQEGVLQQRKRESSNPSIRCLRFPSSDLHATIVSEDIFQTYWADEEGEALLFEMTLPDAASCVGALDVLESVSCSADASVDTRLQVARRALGIA